MDDERMKILKRIEAGEITSEEAVRQISALEQAPPDGTEAETLPPEPERRASPPPDTPKAFIHFWWLPLFVGVATIVVGALLLYAVYGASASGLWAVCGWPLFALGVVITAAAWWLRTARWIHVRVTGKEHIAVSLPLPLKLTAWIIKIVRPFVPQFKDTGVDEVITGLGEILEKDGQPIYVDVNDEDEGEHVQVYIG